MLRIESANETAAGSRPSGILANPRWPGRSVGYDARSGRPSRRVRKEPPRTLVGPGRKCDQPWSGGARRAHAHEFVSFDDLVLEKAVLRPPLECFELSAQGLGRAVVDQPGPGRHSHAAVTDPAEAHFDHLLCGYRLCHWSSAGFMPIKKNRYLSDT